MDRDAISNASIRELAAMIRAGEASPVELAEDAIDRLESTGAELNAVVTIMLQRALREALTAETELAAGVDRGLLHGIPYGVKDLVAVAGAATTWGAVPFADQTFAEDATVVRKLQSAGAVLVAKLAMVELAGGMGYNHPNASLTGPGLTPWNKQHWAGGSSSGSGSAVGARCVPFAIGSETHGSITVPAAFCGVTGLRPTYGRVSRHGAMALVWTMDKLGPLTRSADDAGIVLDAIAGPDRADPTAVSRDYAYTPGAQPLEGFRLGLPKGATDKIHEDVRAAFEGSLGELREFATIEEVELPDLPHEAVANITIWAEASAAFDDFVADGGPAGLDCEADRYTPYARDAISARDYLRAQRVRTRIGREMDALCARYDALVTPTVNWPSPPVDREFDRRAFGGGVPIGGAGNVAGLPAITVPNGIDSSGLPTAIQFVGRAFEENRLIAIAAAFQGRTGWHSQLPPIQSGLQPVET